MSDRAGEVDVTHAFAANLGERDFNATLFADHAAILEALVLAAKALIILHRAKDLGTEKTVAFRLLGTIVNRLRLLDFTVGPGVDLFGTGKSDADRVEMIFRLCCLSSAQPDPAVISSTSVTVTPPPPGSRVALHPFSMHSIKSIGSPPSIFLDTVSTVLSQLTALSFPYQCACKAASVH